MRLQYNVILQCYTSCTFENFYLQCSSIFSLVYGFQLLLTIFFSDAADNKHRYLVEIVVEHSIFECNIQKCVPRSLQLKNIFIFKNRNVQLRFEISKTNTSRD